MINLHANTPMMKFPNIMFGMMVTGHGIDAREDFKLGGWHILIQHRGTLVSLDTSNFC